MYRISLVVVLLVLVSLPGLAADSPATFRGEVEVEVATLYVSVLEGSGRPLEGLEAEDFTVTEDGEVRPITFFEAVGALPPSAAEAAIEPPIAGEASAKAHDIVVLAFDNPRLEKRNRKRVVASFTDMASELVGAGHLVMIADIGAVQQVVQAPTGEVGEAEEALARLARSPAGGDARAAERRFLLRDVGGAGMRPTIIAPLARQLGVQIDAYRDREVQGVMRSLASLEQLIHGVAGFGGRTSIVWVTQDLGLRPATAVYRRYYNRFVSVMPDLVVPELWGTESELVRVSAELLGVAQAGGVTLSMLDASDRDLGLAETDVRGPDLETATSGQISSFGYDISEVSDRTDGARYLSHGSGGTFFGNTRNIDRFASDFAGGVGSYYVLGFTPVPDRDHRLRTVEVTVQRPGARVRHPEKVRRRPPEQELVDATRSALLFGTAFNPLGAWVSFGAPVHGADDVVSWPVDLLVPAAGLLADDEGRAALTVALCVIDGGGDRTAPVVTRLGLELPAEETGAVGTAGLDLATRPGALRLAVSVRDEASGTVSTVVTAFPTGD